MIPQRHSSPTPHAPVPDRSASPLHQPGRLEFAADRLPWQRSLRWREPPRNRRLWLLAWFVAILLTLLELVGFGLAMRSYPQRAPLRSPPVQVVLIEPEPPAVPPPPEPEPPPFVRRPSRVAVAPPKVRTPPPKSAPAAPSDEMRARIGEAGAAAPAPQLFNPDGSVRLDAPVPAAPKPAENPREAAAQRWADIEQRGRNPLNCKKTRFARAFAPDESVGSGIARKYLAWAGLYDPHDTQKRAERAAEGCDPD
ncbi:MAG TPA: hypothetical protein VGC30_09490 [Dokdonella sp.]